MSPIAWDLGHIATFEDLWLAQTPFGRPPLRGDLGAVYDPSTAPRNERGGAALPAQRGRPAPHGARCASARSTCWTGADLGESGGRPARGRVRLRDGPAPRAAAHRDDPPDAPDHDRGARTSRPRGGTCPAAEPVAGEMAFVPAGPFEMGAPARGFAYDNERPRHARDVGAFLIDRVPVTNGAHARVHRGRRLRAAGAVGRRGLGMARARRRGHAPLLGAPRAAATWCARSREERAARPHAARCATCRGTRPTPTRAGRASACRPRPSGRRPPRGTRAAATAAPQPWGHRPANERVANLDQLAFGCAPSGAYAAR